METDRKFSQLHIKKAGKIIPTKRKNLRKRMIRMKKQQIIFCKRTEKCRKGCEAGQKNLPEHPKKYENTQTKREKMHIRKDGSF